IDLRFQIRPDSNGDAVAVVEVQDRGVPYRGRDRTVDLLGRALKPDALGVLLELTLSEHARTNRQRLALGLLRRLGGLLVRRAAGAMDLRRRALVRIALPQNIVGREQSFHALSRLGVPRDNPDSLPVARELLVPMRPERVAVLAAKHERV